MKKTFILLLCVICMLAGCSSTHDGNWINSNLAGTYEKHKPSLKDDFYQSVNYQWLKAHAELPEGATDVSFFGEQAETSTEQIKAMLKETESISPEEILCKTFYSQLTDKDTRNALGMKPAMEIINQYLAIQSYDELWATAYSDTLPDCLPFMWTWTNSDLNELSGFVPGVQVSVAFTTFDTENEDNKKVIDALKDFYTALLVKCGWDESVAAGRVEETFLFEKQLFDNVWNSTGTYTEERWNATYTNLPVFDIAAKKGGSVTSVRIYWEQLFRNMNEACTEENLEQFKWMTILQFLNEYTLFFDEESISLLNDMLKTIYEDYVPVSDENMNIRALELLSEPVSQAWYARYVSDESIAEVTELTKMIISDYKKRFEQADWISEKTRRGAFEKLDNMKFFIGKAEMNDWTSFELFDSSVEGALLKNAVRITRQVEAFNVQLSLGTNQKDRWIQDYPTVINAFYKPNNNSINIFAGIINVMYNTEWPIEKNLAYLGTVIGHEITHAFDNTGCRWDKDGNNADWWDYRDLAVLNQKTLKLAAGAAVKDVVESRNSDTYYQGEVTADAGGMAVMLDIAKTYPDFDYDLFFRSYAEQWCKVFEEASLNSIIKIDTHAIPYVRVNYTFQLFDEFYGTYSIKESDGMYLPPEKRCKVW
ncbi:MAG: M13 family metallopeptidase [Treponema sp.]|nr:M13 family metallopeptidase [Candidatus Treponema caballi]